MATNPTLTALRKLVKTRFKGVLKSGKHQEDGEACAMECMSVLRGVKWTDDPNAVRSFDLRPLNDLNVSDEIRTKHLLPVMAAYDGSLDWAPAKLQAVATRIAIGVVNVLISELVCLPAEVAQACRDATTRAEAEAAASAAWCALSSARSSAWCAAWNASSAARSAAWCAARSAAWCAESAASAARSASRSAASGARSDALERTFIAACKIWLDAARAES